MSSASLGQGEQLHPPRGFAVRTFNLIHVFCERCGYLDTFVDIGTGAGSGSGTSATPSKHCCEKTVN